jgi:putative ABC transport system permease protein
MPPDQREFQLGDLEEEFAERAGRAGRAAARRWMWRQAAQCLMRRTPPRRGPSDPQPHRSGGFMSGLLRDLGFALRLVRRTPLISAAAVLTFALGVGANAAVFSVAWPILGEALPFPDEARLTHILLSIERDSGRGTNPVSPGDYLDLRRATSFEGVAAYNLFTMPRNLAIAEEVEQIQVGSVTEAFFDVLGVTPVQGRGLQAADFEPGVASIVLRESTWKRHFGANPDVVGRPVRLDGTAWTVVGVMPDRATLGTRDVDAWQAQRVDPVTARQQQSYYLALVGRLHEGVSLDAANEELRALMLGVAEQDPAMNRLPDGTPVLARAESFRERLTGPVRPAFLLLIGGAALVLLVAGVNLAGLQVARNLARRRELTVRRALGAGRGRLIRQLTTESLLLAAAGGAAGIGAAALTLAGIRRMAPTVVWYELSPTLTADVVIFTVALTLLAGLVVGLVPAVSAAADRPVSEAATRGGTGSRAAARFRGAVVGAQIALTVVLLVAAALTGASLARVLLVDPGFDASSQLIADVQFVGPSSEAIVFYDDLVTRVEALPGVERACAISAVPLGDDSGGMTFVAEGQTDAERQGAIRLGVTDGCFDTLRMRVLAGRGFQRQETTSVAIVSESMGRSLWPDGSSPVGKRIHIGLAAGPLFEVVGVASDIRAAALESAAARQVWFSASRAWPMPQRLIVRTAVPPTDLARPIRSLLAELAPDLALANVRTMQSVLDASTASRRFVLSLLGGFALIALALCAVGVYGMLAHQVGQRRLEIGIRMALGARPPNVTVLIARQVLTGVGAGVLAGLGAAWALSSFLASQLFQMSATDPRVYGGVAVFVMIVATLAAWPPIRRATRVPPLTALRE